jgi:ribonuclease P protein component
MRRANRLRTAEDFSVVYRAGVRARAGSVVAICVAGDDAEPRVGVTCSRRVGNAVVRNRAKRRVRAAIDGLAGRLAPGTRVVVQATSATIREDFQKLESDVFESLRRVGAIDA